MPLGDEDDPLRSSLDITRETSLRNEGALNAAIQAAQASGAQQGGGRRRRGGGQAGPQSQYAAAKFQEWQEQAPLREALMNARLQHLQGQIESQNAAHEYNMWKDSQITGERAAFYKGLPYLENSLSQAGIRPGSQEYANEFATYVSQFPWAKESGDVVDIIKQHARVNDTEAQIQSKLDLLRGTTGQPAPEHPVLQRGETAHINEAGQVDISRSESGAERPPIPAEIIAQYGRLQGGIAFHNEMAAAQAAKETKPNIPYEKAAKLHQDQVQMQYLEKQYPQLKEIGAGQTTEQSQVKHLGKYNPETGEFE